MVPACHTRIVAIPFTICMPMSVFYVTRTVLTLLNATVVYMQFCCAGVQYFFMPPCLCLLSSWFALCSRIMDRISVEDMNGPGTSTMEQSVVNHEDEHRWKVPRACPLRLPACLVMHSAVLPVTYSVTSFSSPCLYVPTVYLFATLTFACCRLTDGSCLAWRRLWRLTVLFRRGAYTISRYRDRCGSASCWLMTSWIGTCRRCACLAARSFRKHVPNYSRNAGYEPVLSYLDGIDAGICRRSGWCHDIA
jgi:uncharacterized protein YceK